MAASKKTSGAKGSGGKSPDRRNADQRVRDLAELLKETGLSEIEIEEGGTRIRVAVSGVVAGPVATAPAAATPVAAPATPSQSAATSEPAGAHPGTLASPMVGTAFLAAEPGANPFVQVGDRVTEGQTVLIIEAMKVMNSIPAPRAGKVIEIMVSDAEPVEFGQPLMVIE